MKRNTLALTLTLSIGLLAPLAAQLEIKDTKGKHLDILSGEKVLVRYMYEHDISTDEKKHATYKPFLHVFDAAGKAPITMGPGGQYTHHRGIFIGWSKLGFNGKSYDRWHMKDGAIVHQPLDALVLARLEREGLRASPPADRATLARRVALDLTGLPLPPGELDTFLEDRSDGAYERLVDRLLRSPRHAERLALVWLDAARFADTNGYQTDGERDMWRWRDWVIEAFARNLSFDRFTVEQLAGDLLPRPTLDQMIATGFHRNHRGNGEGGAIDAEYLVEYVVDRVETTSTVWLGLTLGCARCHDHKYDPFSQREFYRLFAYFHNVPEMGRTFKYGNSPPFIRAPTKQQQKELATLDGKIDAAQAAFESMSIRRRSERARWEELLRASPTPVDSRIGAGLVVAVEPPDAEPVDAGDVAKFGFYDRFTLSARLKSRGLRGGTVLSRMTDVPEIAGYAVRFADGRICVDLVKRWLDDAIRVRTKQVFDAGRELHVAVTYDGSRLAAGVRVFVDGQPVETLVDLDELNQPFDAEEPLRVGQGAAEESVFDGRIPAARPNPPLQTGAGEATTPEEKANALADFYEARCRPAQP